MINAVRGAVCVTMVCLLGCGGGGSGVISGKATFTDGSDATGLPVTLLGPIGKRIQTGAGGAYSFDKLPRGVYQVSVEGADTREGRLSFGTESDGSTPVTAPDLSFNPVASVKGKVTNSAGPASGATVYLSGSDRVSLTDAEGSYGFFDVPTGTYSLVAKATGLLAQQASAVVTLKRGKNEPAPLMLGNDLSAAGKLEGSLAVFNGASPKDIKVSVADISALTDELGRFSLTLPPGEYEPIAELAGYPYPRQSLGLATVRTGQTTTLPLKTLTNYKAFQWGSALYAASWMATSESDWAVLQLSVDTDYSTEHYFVDTRTLERRLFAIGSISKTHLSKNGKWVVFVPGSGKGVIAVNSASGQTHSIPSSFLSNGPVVTSDETTLMFHSGSPENALVRVDLGTGAVTRIPAFSGSAFQTTDRFLARTTLAAPFDVQLVTATTATTVLTNMQVLNSTAGSSISGGTFLYPLIWAYDCAAACNVQVLGPTATTASAVTTVITSTPYAITGSVKEWLGLAWEGLTPGRALVKVADGTGTTLPATTTQLAFNETASRVVTYSSGSLGNELRENVVPPSATSTVLFTTPVGATIVGAWLSPTRFMAFGSGPTVKRVDLKAGVPTPDDDVTLNQFTQSSPLFAPPGVMWVKTSTGTRAAAVYDSAELSPDTLGTTANNNFQMVGSRASVLSPLLGKFAGFTDGASVFVLDGVKSEARRLGIGSFPFVSGLFVPTDRMKIQRVGGLSLQYFESGRVTSLSEPGMYVSASGIASLPKGGTAVAGIQSAAPSNVLFLSLIP